MNPTNKEMQLRKTCELYAYVLKMQNKEVPEMTNYFKLRPFLQNIQLCTTPLINKKSIKLSQ